MAPPPFLRLAAGVAATAVLADGWYIWNRQTMLAHLGQPIAAVMAAHAVADGAVRWTDARGFTWRTARLSGTANPATRAAILADVRRLPGISDAVWEAR
jgi:hypothetical protein